MNKDLDMQKIQYELYATCKRLGLDFQSASYEEILEAACKDIDVQKLKLVNDFSNIQLGKNSKHSKIVKRVMVERGVSQSANLSLAKNTMFDDTNCDFWQNEQGEVFMTITQLATALEYTSKSAIEKMVQRNEYLKDTEFSATDILSAPDGKKYETRIFTEDGIYEVTMLSRQPKAKEFRAWVRQVIKSLRKGELVVQETQLSKEQSLDMIKAKTKQAQLLYNMASEFKDVLPASQIERLIKQVTDILH